MRVTISVLGRFHAFDLARELAARGHLERLITSYPRFTADRFGLDPARVAGLPSLDLLRRAAARYPRVAGLNRLAQALLDARAARRIPPATELFVGWSGSCLSALREARRLGAATVVERGSTHIETQAELLSEEYRAFGFEPRLPGRSTVERELAEYAEADLVMVPSEFARRTFVQRGFAPERVAANPFGADLSHFTPAADRPEGERLRVLAVGRVGIRKGSHRLVSAFSALERDDVELHFVGPIEPELAGLARGNAHPRIHFHGAVPQADLLDHYRQADLFCLPSLEEGFAMVVFQAMACGLPCLVTPNTGAEGLVRPGVEGWLVDAAWTDGLAERLDEALRDREVLRERGRAARRRVREGYAWSDYGARAVAIYEALLAGGTVPASPLSDRPRSTAASTRAEVV